MELYLVSLLIITYFCRLSLFISNMPNSYFQFKQFTVSHDKCGMKVGTDGVLLGAWVDVSRAKKILDIGTGTGLLALMTAQRSVAHIVALEIDEHAAKQAEENISSSPWADRIEIVKTDFKEYVSDDKFDVVISNPPYFVDSLASPDDQRTMARHSGDLTYTELLKGVSRVLSIDGAFSVIIPIETADSFKDIAELCGLFPCRQLLVITRPGGAPKRALVTFSFVKQVCEINYLLIEEARHQYSKEYIALTKDYYLKM